ncbi:MAG: sulfite reductase flavoprotein subunit alpha [Waddliaceae bacterium]
MKPKNCHIDMDPFSRENPYFATIKERYSLCKSDSGKDTLHIVLDITGSGIQYNVGDCVAVQPSNDPAIVQRILNTLGATGEERVQDKRSSELWPFREYLIKKSDINKISKKFVQELYHRQTNPQKKEALESLFVDGAQASLKEFQTSHEIWDVLEEHPEAAFSPQEICHLLMPLMPRFYSIASSMHAVGEEIHLTIALQQWISNGKPRSGVCTQYLCNLAPLQHPLIPVYIHPHKGFTLPQDPHAPIIMVGPGTGVAPFRAFLQERVSLNCPGKNWLFFGEWNRDHHFYYEEDWKLFATQGKLRIDLAFSRDQENKIYVQHRMREKGKELFQWLREGAYIYVCGDANRMAKDVEAALHRIIQEHGNLSEEEAQNALKHLRKEKRYLKDVY